MTKKVRDLIYSVVLLAFSIAGIVYAEVSIDSNVKYTLARPDRYVQLWMGALAILSVLLLIRTLKNNDRTVAPKIFGLSTVVTVVWFLAYLLVMKYVGFTISSFVFVGGLTLFYFYQSLDHKPTKQEWIKAAVFAVVFSLILSVGAGLLFRKVLSVRLPDIIF